MRGLRRNLNCSFEAIEVMYINKINIPPKKIKNNEYENQKVFVINPENNTIIIVWIINIRPKDRGWVIEKNKNDDIIKNIIKRVCKIKSENSLFKILILGINEELLYSFLSLFKKTYLF